MSFLSLDEFLDFFPRINLTKSQFYNTFRITYKNNPTLKELFDEKNIAEKKSVIRSTEDARYLNREKIVDYFYDIIIDHRYLYLSKFYKSYFEFKNPYTLKWNVDPLMTRHVLDGDLLDSVNNTSDDELRLEVMESILEEPLERVSLQKNDAMRIMIRNLNYLDILHTTRITNTSKSRVSFWETLLKVYNELSLEDRFFAPSSIGLFLREKKGEAINYNNFFYLFQQYQPKASILNPYTVYWILENYFNGERLFTPVLSWSSYLAAFFHTKHYREYVGVDVIPRVCDRARSLARYYEELQPLNASRKVTIYCQPSESLLQDAPFRKKYNRYFDSVLWCPPYFDMEIYEGENQSIRKYPEYGEWLENYFRATVELCYFTTKRNAIIGVIMNDYYTLDGQYYPLIEDFNLILLEYFKLTQIVELVNRTSPLRVNKKGRTERLFLYIRE